jgi:DNA-binding XRE family transcriptional regulator
MTKIKTTSLDQLKNKYIGQSGYEAREKYEMELSTEVIGQMIKEVRLKKNLTQEQLGKLVGVQKAQISKLESNAKNVTLSTILKIFKALKTRVKLNIEMENAAS